MPETSSLDDETYAFGTFSRNPSRDRNFTLVPLPRWVPLPSYAETASGPSHSTDRLRTEPRYYDRGALAGVSEPLSGERATSSVLPRMR
jgi:hypothetical protein